MNLPMAKVSTLVYVLDDERCELIDMGEILDLESSVFRRISRALDLCKITPEPALVSSILEKAGTV